MESILSGEGRLVMKESVCKYVLVHKGRRSYEFFALNTYSMYFY